jgi:hypothetical protein
VSSRIARAPSGIATVTSGAPASFAYGSLVLMAVAAGAYQGVLVTRAVNDTFLHLAMSRQVAHGDLPVRDFFDSGLVLMYAISAAAQSLFGYRLLAEAIVVAVSVTLATLLAGLLVRRLTGSLAGALLSELLILVAAPRPYSYPKLIVYAVAAPLWWGYVAKPSAWRAVMLGVWTAVAFYFRPDHCVYMAAAVVFAAVAADGMSVVAVRRLVTAGVVCVILVAPWLVFAQRAIGIRAYLAGGLAQGVAEEVHTSGHTLPRWPVRSRADVIRFDPPDVFAPVVSLRWAAASGPAERQGVLRRYQLSDPHDDGNVTRVRLSALAIERLHDLVGEPSVEDTAGIERGSATVSTTGWPFWQRMAFRYPPLRLRILPGLDTQKAASDAATVLFQVIPVLAIVAAVLFRRRLTGIVTARGLAGFGAATLVVNAGLIRSSYDVRTIDAVVLPALLAGCAVGGVLQLTRASGRVMRAAVIVMLASASLLLVRSVAGAGELGDRLWYLTGEWRDAEHLRGTWADIQRHLAASPPVEYWQGRTPPAEVQLALYARDCVPAGERLMVLWFAPEIYYYADRLMAQRHLVFIPGWSSMVDEQRLTVQKVRRAAPPLVFASAARLDTVTRSIYPGLVDYVHQYYQPAGIVHGDEDYVVFARRDRRPVRTYGAQQWPCYADRA